MRPGAHIVLRAAARFYAPLIALFALSLFAVRGAGEGVGFIAGLAFALMLIVHVIVFGAGAQRRAFPTGLARAFLALGLILTLVGAGAPRVAFAPQIIEAGLFLTTLSAASLGLSVLVGRAPTLRDEA